MRIAQCDQDHIEPWLRLRIALWPEAADQSRNDIANILKAGAQQIALIAYDADEAVGLAEAALRHDYVNGCETSPVLFLEGIYVSPPYRRRGIARALVASVAAWGKAQGCTEFASSILADNAASHAMHTALGFEETERVIYFRKRL